MFKGFYTVATGMITQQRRTELLTNNLSNANTPGFKADQSTIRSFPDMLMSSIGKTNAPAHQQAGGAEYMSQVGALNTGTYLQETLPNYIQGQIYNTDFTTDMALIDGTYHKMKMVLQVQFSSDLSILLVVRLTHVMVISR